MLQTLVSSLQIVRNLQRAPKNPMREIPCVKAKTVCLMINPEATWQIAAKCNRQMDLQMTLKLHNQIGVINGYISRGSSETCQPQIEAASVSLGGSYCVCVCVRV